MTTRIDGIGLPAQGDVEPAVTDALEVAGRQKERQLARRPTMYVVQAWIPRRSWMWQARNMLRTLRRMQQLEGQATFEKRREAVQGHEVPLPWQCCSSPRALAWIGQALFFKECGKRDRRKKRWRSKVMQCAVMCVGTQLLGDVANTTT